MLLTEFDSISNMGYKKNELKFCEVSWNRKSMRYWKFQLSILTNKKVLFKNITMDSSYFSQKMATWRPNFPHPWLWKDKLFTWKANCIGGSISRVPSSVVASSGESVRSCVQNSTSQALQIRFSTHSLISQFRNDRGHHQTRFFYQFLWVGTLTSL